MSLRSWSTGLAALLMLLCGCVTQDPVPDPPAANSIGSKFGYRAIDTGRLPGREPALPKRYVVLAFSGGGTRAAALAQGVLRELEATPSPNAPNLTLLDAVDMISSTSGGSVAAANFVLHGPKDYHILDEPHGFLRHNNMTTLIAGVLDPFDIAERAVTPKSRVQLLSAMFSGTLFGNATFETLRQQRARHPPLLILNAADMATGERFPFVQRQLDRLCLNLLDIRLADAVSASAAFPVALTPMRLPNRSPCPAQLVGPGARVIDRFLNEGGANRADLASSCKEGRPILDTRPAAFLSRSRRQFPLLNLDPCGQPLPPDDPRRVRFVHLLDGGIADNVGLAEPLETLTDRGDDPRVVNAIRDGDISEVVVIAVNARSQPATDVGRDNRTPGMIAMAGSVMSAAIDSRSSGLFSELESLSALLRDTFRERPTGPPKVTVISVSFELIRDQACRRRFQEIGTNWSLSDRKVTSVEEIASAILRANPDYLALAGTTDPQETRVGLARASNACNRLSSSMPVRPLAFGPR